MFWATAVPAAGLASTTLSGSAAHNPRLVAAASTPVLEGVVRLMSALLHFVLTRVGPAEVASVFRLGLLTQARLLQPLVQFLASFPANVIFPFATLFFIRSHIPIGCRTQQCHAHPAGEGKPRHAL